MSERKIKLQIKDMTKKYDNGDGVEHINLDIYEGEIVTFLGPSGCGKTTPHEMKAVFHLKTPAAIVDTAHNFSAYGG